MIEELEGCDVFKITQYKGEDGKLHLIIDVVRPPPEPMEEEG